MHTQFKYKLQSYITWFHHFLNKWFDWKTKKANKLIGSVWFLYRLQRVGTSAHLQSQFLSLHRGGMCVGVFFFYHLMFNWGVYEYNNCCFLKYVFI